MWESRVLNAAFTIFGDLISMDRVPWGFYVFPLARRGSSSVIQMGGGGIFAVISGHVSCTCSRQDFPHAM